MLLLFGPKNVGKTFLQHLIHFGQGGISISHDLILSGGNSFTSGASS